MDIENFGKNAEKKVRKLGASIASKFTKSQNAILAIVLAVIIAIVGWFCTGLTFKIVGFYLGFGLFAACVGYVFYEHAAKHAKDEEADEDYVGRASYFKDEKDEEEEKGYIRRRRRRSIEE